VREEVRRQESVEKQIARRQLNIPYEEYRAARLKRKHGVEDGGFFVKKSERAQGKNIAYCPLWWKSAKADVPLNPKAGEGYYYCKIHEVGFETAAYRALQERERGAEFDFIWRA
jgi:hypothetical protein